MQALQTVNKISFKNILFLTDFTEASQTALAYALGLAKHFGAQVYPAHACDPVILTETAAPDILDEVEENSRRRLNDLAKDNNIAGTPLFARGPVADAVPGWINDHGIDLIVMGTHGRKGLKHFLLGSVAEAVFRHATCPVLTVGPHVTIRPYHDFKADKILFPTDLGPLHRRANLKSRSCTWSPWKKHSSATALHWWQSPSRSWKRCFLRTPKSGASLNWWWKSAIPSKNCWAMPARSALT